jgi:hypothetical protein
MSSFEQTSQGTRYFIEALVHFAELLRQLVGRSLIAGILETLQCKC